ncbi:glycoside hydrolase family 2 protein [Saccharicrinis aurantiacus]|uniref:glycoside hydrolase family 2 protein n=1 Tax=Saccharicrinis aurantiacus TaxID=1849719 RepID=UPI0008380867|nr:glycoside hydrolase family 2 [Saccharicrinis aurantiacus]
MQKIKLLCTLLLVVLLISCNTEKQTISLNGNWYFLASNSLTEAEVFKTHFSEWDTLSVPGNWDTSDKYAEFVGKGYYQRTINVPSNWDNKQIRLKFDAVYQTAKVWLNGELLGTHVGGYTPFEFNITKLVDAGNAYQLVVQADNTYKRGAWWAWGGISRNVALVANNDVRIMYQHIDAIPDFENNSLTINVKYKLENNATEVQNVSILSSVNDGGNSKEEYQKEISIKGNSTAFHQYVIQAKLSDYQLWELDHPYLYRLSSKIKHNGTVLDYKDDKFGVRKIEAIGEQLFFNNRPIKMDGINRVHDHPEYGNTEPDILVKSDIMDMKALGTSFSRMMHAPLAPNLLNFCDSVGYLIIEEIPVWGDDDPQSFPNNPQTKKWMQELITRDYNHPCVVGWSVGNELRDSIAPWGAKSLTTEQYGYVNSMLDYVGSLDSTRLKTYVSITAYGKHTDMSNEPYDKLDLICINSYGDAIRNTELTHEKFPNKPIFLSEIGLKQIGGGADAELDEKLINYIKTIKEYPYVVGLSLWCYNDYRSNYKGTPESGFREWGVVDELRNKKKAYWQLKEVFARD